MNWIGHHYKEVGFWFATAGALISVLIYYAAFYRRRQQGLPRAPWYTIAAMTNLFFFVGGEFFIGFLSYHYHWRK